MTRLSRLIALTGTAVAAAFVFVGTFTSAQAAADAAKPIKVLLVAGGCCHDYAHQKDILKKGLEERANVQVTIAYDTDRSTHHLNPVYNNPDWAKGYDLILHDECSADVKDLPTIERILAPHKAGLPAVNLHCAMHCYRSEGWNNPKTPTPWQDFLGLQSSAHTRQAPITIHFTDTTSPITAGMKDWTTIHEELYNNFAGHILPTAHALATGTNSAAKDLRVVAWTNTYNGNTRVFSTTIGHNNQTVSDPRYLDLVTRGVLWATHHINPDGTPAAGYGPGGK